MASTTDELINFYLNDLSVGYLTMYSIYVFGRLSFKPIKIT